jgi:hypothetical protein
MSRTARIFALAALAALIVSCSNPAGGGGANSSRVVSGNITVPDSSYWSLVKIGTFSGGTAGANPGLEVEDNGLGIGANRLCYSKLDNGSAKPIDPVAGTSYAISGSGATSRSYTYELPATVPTSSITYYFSAWYDGNLNGKIDLIDQNAFLNPTAVAASSEYNRLSTKQSVDNPAKTLVINGFGPEQDTNGGYTGNYKYLGNDGASYNEQLSLETSSSGFNFSIGANSGW